MVAARLPRVQIYSVSIGDILQLLPLVLLMATRNPAFKNPPVEGGKGSLTSHSLQGELYIQTVGKALGFLNHQQYHLVVLLTKTGLSKRLPHGYGTCKLEDKHQQNQKFFPQR